MPEGCLALVAVELQELELGVLLEGSVKVPLHSIHLLKHDAYHLYHIITITFFLILITDEKN